MSSNELTSLVRDPCPVALDAMGSDEGPRAAVEGAIAAVRELAIPVAVVGRVVEIEMLVRGFGGPFAGLSLIDAPDVISMEERAVASLRRKAGASILVAMQAVRDDRACAVVSAGNSGAVVAGAIRVLGRVPGVERPGIAVLSPSANGGVVVFIDMGAVSDPRPAHLVDFAYLATSYLRHVGGVPSPRVALLSNGSEPGKGNHLVRETHRLLASAPNLHFVGNTEGNTMLAGGVDVVVCDGFTGNVALKTAEGVIGLVQRALRDELSRSWHSALIAAALRRSFRAVARRFDYREPGGALLLGVNGVVIIAHGRSDAAAFRNALATAARAARKDLPALISTEMAQARRHGLTGTAGGSPAGVR